MVGEGEARVSSTSSEFFFLVCFRVIIRFRHAGSNPLLTRYHRLRPSLSTSPLPSLPLMCRALPCRDVGYRNPGYPFLCVFLVFYVFLLFSYLRFFLRLCPVYYLFFCVFFVVFVFHTVVFFC